VASDLYSQPAFWGAAGAFIYAAPLFSTCAFSAKATGGSWVRCGFEFVTALAIGTLAAAATTPVIQEVFHRDSAAWMRAIASTTGLLANRVAPRLVNAAPDAVIDWVGRLFRRSPD
jgi:hypothetical protein